MLFKVDLINSLIFFVLLVNSMYGIIIYLKNRKSRSNFSFYILTISISLWCLSMFLYRGFLVHDTVLIMARLLYFTAITIPTAFVFFISFFTEYEKVKKIRSVFSVLIFLPMTLLCILSIVPNWFIVDVVISSKSETVIIFNKVTHLFFGLYVIGYFCWAYIILFLKFKKSSGNIKMQLAYIFIGTLCTTIITLTTNLTLLYFNIFKFNWFGQISVILMISFIFYSITHYKLFDIRFITAQIITFSLWIFIGVRILFATTAREMIIESSLLITTIIFGILLIKSAINEINRRIEIDSHREQLRQLNSSLSEKVAEQTKDIKSAYDLEMKARRELEKLNETKDQFIMITQHNLRTPVTNIRYRLELMQNLLQKQAIDDSETTVYPNKSNIINTLADTQISLENLNRIVDDFLNITTLKVGSQILNTTMTSIKQILEKVLLELKIDIDQRKIIVNYPKDDNDWPEIKIDANKIQEVITIIIENAIKYNFEYGLINITNQIQNNIFKIIIQNTGVGIAKEDRSNIFERLFYRSKKAQSAHPRGMGIGLTVSRAIVRAHHGEISIDSEGENKGAIVTITLPIDFMATLQS